MCFLMWTWRSSHQIKIIYLAIILPSIESYWKVCGHKSHTWTSAGSCRYACGLPSEISKLHRQDGRPHKSCKSERSDVIQCGFWTHRIVENPSCMIGKFLEGSTHPGEPVQGVSPSGICSWEFPCSICIGNHVAFAALCFREHLYDVSPRHLMTWSFSRIRDLRSKVQWIWVVFRVKVLTVIFSDFFRICAVMKRNVIP